MPLVYTSFDDYLKHCPSDFLQEMYVEQAKNFRILQLVHDDMLCMYGNHEECKVLRTYLTFTRDCKKRIIKELGNRLDLEDAFAE
jgi:hypothetical protein